ncbi:SDR family NAD(P)-dependent oxidoreductase [Rhizobiaceae bacterium n13]|uniref:SDR family NAD(P)-dependent oxidoreductase n=1 Tax=Ferirhizobium litorale TaxID=2927786 RepID=A0AAE3U4A3_9HYPH|nr:SDR family NAD(P)-dependent oxidoreductase [Fererhizobium litorale]MDI7864429.1 SDR family NAD(P)-dependent oxidoreductase [Fererhizobium litorale]MDI7924657.1 SDR family NAD(P)-dependent oxidoreductase [Fererhizobium litorale]
MTGADERRSAVVVVGASQGIGRAMATVAARDGGAIVLVARSADALAEAAAGVGAAGGEAFVLELDLLADDASDQLQAFLDANGLYCDVLVNSAGLGLRGAATLLPHDDQMGIVDLNVRALTDLTLRFLPGMVSRGRGGVINLGSIAGFTPGPNMALYYASKSFVRSFSEALHREVHRTGVTVTCVAPGPVSTEFLQKSGASRATLFRVLPRLKPDYVAERAWQGFRSGRRTVVPGAIAKLASVVTALLPSAVLLPLIDRLQRRSSDLCPCGSGKPYVKCHGRGGFWSRS